MKRLIVAGAALIVLRAAVACRMATHDGHRHGRPAGPPRFGRHHHGYGRFATGPVSV